MTKSSSPRDSRADRRHEEQQADFHSALLGGICFVSVLYIFSSPDFTCERFLLFIPCLLYHKKKSGQQAIFIWSSLKSLFQLMQAHQISAFYDICLLQTRFHINTALQVFFLESSFSIVIPFWIRVVTSPFGVSNNYSVPNLILETHITIS